MPDDRGSTDVRSWLGFVGKGNFLRDCVQQLKDKGFRVFPVCDPDADERAMEVAASTGTEPG